MTEENTEANEPEVEIDEAQDQPEEESLVVGTNPLELPWPNDSQGFLKALKSGTNSARRVNGDAERLDAFKKCLRILEAFANEVYEKDVEKRRASKENSVSARLRVQEKQRRQAEARAADLEKLASSIRSNAGIDTSDSED